MATEEHSRWEGCWALLEREGEDGSCYCRWKKGGGIQEGHHTKAWERAEGSIKDSPCFSFNSKYFTLQMQTDLGQTATPRIRPQALWATGIPTDTRAAHSQCPNLPSKVLLAASTEPWPSELRKSPVCSSLPWLWCPWAQTERPWQCFPALVLPTCANELE